MRHQKRLCVEVVGARNLESPQSVDAYCVVGLCDIKPRKALGRPRLAASPSFRSSTVTASNNPTWGHVVEFVVPARPASARLRVQLFSEKNFFFDMFPSSSNSSDEEGEKLRDQTDYTAKEQWRSAVSKPQIFVNGGKGIYDSDSDDVVTLSEEEDEDDDQVIDEDDVWPVIEKEALAATESIDDELLGVVEINSSLLCKPSRVVTDSWYCLGGTRTGEVRIRTIWYEGAKRVLTVQDREVLFEEQVKHSMTKSMSDFYGFNISETAREEWVHLRSYQDCREERRVEDWTKLYGTQFPERLRRCSYKEKDTEEKTLLMQLARAGIPRHLRERAYFNLSGASEKQANAGPNYYAELVKKAETMETETFRQIELDIDRTFGHSGTTICSVSGRDQLRRILRAYSLRNPSVGYCQGLNFIVAFLMLMADEEVIFWLLSVFCEDLYPGYYSPAMSDIQRDMLVLKQLIAEELPQLDEFAAEVGLPLELLGSQWLLCLFTTTFPPIFSDTPSSSSPQNDRNLNSADRTMDGVATGNERAAYKLKGYFDLAKEEIDKAVRAEEWGLADDAISHYQNAQKILAEGISTPVPSYITSSEQEKVKSYRQKLTKWKSQVSERLQTLSRRAGGTSAVKISAPQTQRLAVSQSSSSARKGESRTAPSSGRGSSVMRVPNSGKDSSVARVPINSISSHKPSQESANGYDPKLVDMINSVIVDRSPSVKWEDIAGLEKAKQALLEMVILPTKRKDLFTGLRRPARGLLLFGPPGTGKTMLAKAVASESEATFFNVSASSLTSKWVGEGEKLVKTLFMVAISRKPSVIFMDEIDSVMSTRTTNENEASRRLKSEFLVQFDGVTSNSDDLVIVIGATNKPQELDDAVLRRLVKRIYIPLPDANVRRQLLKHRLKGKAFSLPGGDLDRLVRDTEGYSGSDLQALCEEAAMMPIRELGANILRVDADQVRGLRYGDFQKAMTVIRPSLQKSKWEELERWNQEFGAN